MGQAVNAAQPESAAGSTEQDARRAALALADSCDLVMLASNGPDGYPWVKAMVKAGSDGLGTIWFGTHRGAARTAQFRADPRASVYFMNAAEYRTLLLIGTVSVCSDRAVRERLWREEFAAIYPLGVDDPDFLLLEFTAQSAQYQHGMEKAAFTV